MSLTRTFKRLVSLDVLRGITVCGMILVNNAGACGYAYAPLKHAKWDGFTPADLVFPAFMFIMGVSIYLSLNKSNFDWRISIARILRRAVLIFVSGVALKWILAFIATGEYTGNLLRDCCSFGCDCSSSFVPDDYRRFACRVLFAATFRERI